MCAMTKIPAERQDNVPGVAHSELPDNARILDVRNADEWDLGHAPHALHIPLPELEARLAELPKDERVVVTCRGGGRAGRAVAFLREMGYDAVNLEGGMLEWQRSNRPMEHFGPGAPEVR